MWDIRASKGKNNRQFRLLFEPETDQPGGQRKEGVNNIERRAFVKFSGKASGKGQETRHCCRDIVRLQAAPVTEDAVDLDFLIDFKRWQISVSRRYYRDLVSCFRQFLTDLIGRATSTPADRGKLVIEHQDSHGHARAAGFR